MSTLPAPFLIDVKAIPKSKFTAIFIDKSNNLCIRVTSSPERGQANQAIIQLIARTLKLPQAHITIVQGLTSRQKRIKIISSFINKEDLIKQLAPPTQLTLY
eukprot:gene322-413_t